MSKPSVSVVCPQCRRVYVLKVDVDELRQERPRAVCSRCGERFDVLSRTVEVHRETLEPSQRTRRRERRARRAARAERDGARRAPTPRAARRESLGRDSPGAAPPPAGEPEFLEVPPETLAAMPSLGDPLDGPRRPPHEETGLDDVGGGDDLDGALSAGVPATPPAALSSPLRGWSLDLDRPLPWATEERDGLHALVHDYPPAAMVLEWLLTERTALTGRRSPPPIPTGPRPTVPPLGPSSEGRPAAGSDETPVPEDEG